MLKKLRRFEKTLNPMLFTKVAKLDEALVYDRKPKTLTELEKLMGKADFAEKIGQFVVKPVGKPTLAPMSDKREPYNKAAADFAGVENNG